MNNFNNPYNNPYMMNMWQTPYTNPLQNEINRLNQRKQEIDAQLNMLQNQNQQTPVIQNFQLAPQQQGNQSFDFNGSFVEKEEDVNAINNQTNKPLFLMNKNKNEFYIKNPDGTVQSFSFEQKDKFEQMTQNNSQLSQSNQNDQIGSHDDEIKLLDSKITQMNDDIKTVGDNITSLFAILRGFNDNLERMGLMYQNSLNSIEKQNISDLDVPIVDAQIKEKKPTKKGGK